MEQEALRVKAAVTAEGFLQFVYGVEHADRAWSRGLEGLEAMAAGQHRAGRSATGALCDQLRGFHELGCQVDSFAAHPGRLHPDADAGHEFMTRYFPPDTQAMVIAHAKAGTRPDWRPAAARPRWEPVWIEGPAYDPDGRPTRGRYRTVRHAGRAVGCLVRHVQVDEAEQLRARIEWLQWVGVMLQITNHFKRFPHVLRDYQIVRVDLPVEPWAETRLTTAQ